MKISELINLTEAPIPDDWDKDVFRQGGTYKGMIEYAKARAEQLGRGSSRVAFNVNYQGRRTALKVATNRKGLVQNEEESNLLDDYYLESIGIVIPLIDYDEESMQPRWLHTEFAEKVSKKQLERFFGGDMDLITRYLDAIQGRIRQNIPDLPESIRENENFQKLEELVSNYGLPAGDLARKANWGIYRGRPVIIDLGYTDVTAKLY